MTTRISRFALILLLCGAFTLPAWAKGKEGKVQFFRSIHIQEGDDGGDLVCIGCSVYVQGSCGDVAIIGGSILVEGQVKGDIAVVGGSAKFTDTAQVAGDVAVVGGRVARDPGAVVQGDIAEKAGAYVLPLLIIIPLLPVVLLVGFVWWLLSRPKPQVRLQQPYVRR